MVIVQGQVKVLLHSVYGGFWPKEIMLIKMKDIMYLLSSLLAAKA